MLSPMIVAATMLLRGEKNPQSQAQAQPHIQVSHSEDPAAVASAVAAVKGEILGDKTATTVVGEQAPAKPVPERPRTLADVPKLPRDHEAYKNRGRCADHLQDVVEAAQTPQFGEAARIFWDCLWSQKG